MKQAKTPPENCTREFSITKVNDIGFSVTVDQIIVETWINISINGVELSPVPATPIEQKELTVGILFGEGLINDGDKFEVDVRDNTVNLTSEKPISVKNLDFISGCLSKKVTADPSLQKLTVNEKFKSEIILKNSKTFQSRPSLYRDTGGTHSAAIVHKDNFLTADDVSRRSAVSKVLGKAFLQNLSLTDKYLITTGRISSELVVRANRVGIPMIASISAPTDKAVILGEALGVTVCGFVRGRRMNIYSYPERIVS